MHSTIRIPVGATYGADEALPDMPQALTVADAIYHTVHGYPGGVVALAARMGVSPNTLTHKANPNNATHHLHPAELVAMQQLSGNAAVLHAMAAALGYTCIPAVADQSGGDPVDAFMHQAAAQGKYVAAVADAMLVPAPSRNEVNRVARMAEDLIDTTTALLSVLRGRMRKAPEGES